MCGIIQAHRCITPLLPVFSPLHILQVPAHAMHSRIAQPRPAASIFAEPEGHALVQPAGGTTPNPQITDKAEHRTM
jgi:hypothetical protein